MTLMHTLSLVLIAFSMAPVITAKNKEDRIARLVAAAAGVVGGIALVL